MRALTGGFRRRRSDRLCPGAALCALTAAIAATRTSDAGTCAPSWNDRIGAPGANSAVSALLVRYEGDFPVLYAGGRFTQMDGIPASKIARWDGFRWHALGSGVTGVGAAINALAEFNPGAGPIVVAGGEFTGAGGAPVSRLAAWNGSNWSDVGGGANGSVFALAVFDDGTGEALYVGGAFSKSGAVDAANIARWDGSAWAPLGAGLNGTVYALIVHDDGLGAALYAGGDFSSSGATALSHLARWNGGTWTPVGSGLNGPALALATSNDGVGARLFAGGSFTSAGETIVSSVVSWDGVTYHALDGGVDASVRALAVFDDGFGPALYAGGAFLSVGGTTPASHLARWNGTTWSGVGVGANNAVFALAAAPEPSVIGPALFAGGSFALAGGLASAYVARWVDCGDPPGDVNGDGDLSAADLVRLPNCVRGPTHVVQAFCRAVDMDVDTDVDLRDVGAFQNLYTGSSP